MEKSEEDDDDSDEEIIVLETPSFKRKRINFYSQQLTKKSKEGEVSESCGQLMIEESSDEEESKEIIFEMVELCETSNENWDEKKEEETSHEDGSDTNEVRQKRNLLVNHFEDNTLDDDDNDDDSDADDDQRLNVENDDDGSIDGSNDHRRIDCDTPKIYPEIVTISPDIIILDNEKTSDGDSSIGNSTSNGNDTSNITPLSGHTDVLIGDTQRFFIFFFLDRKGRRSSRLSY